MTVRFNNRFTIIAVGLVTVDVVILNTMMPVVVVVVNLDAFDDFLIHRPRAGYSNLF